MRPSPEFLSSLESMTETYHQALMGGDQSSPSGLARAYLASRGLTAEAAACYRLGMVTGEIPDHVRYAGMISIPYLTKLAGPVSLKFRQAHHCTDEHEHAKYIGPYDSRIYNPLALDRADQLGYVAITEGEVNAATLDFFCGIPAVGIPGAAMWKAHPEWKELFRGYRSILVFPDDDDDGMKLAGQITGDLDTARTIILPDGMDANEAYPVIGAAGIRRAADVS